MVENVLFILHILVAVVAALIALHTWYSYLHTKNIGIKFFSLFYVAITAYAIAMIVPYLWEGEVAFSQGHLIGRMLIFLAIIFILNTTIFTRNVPKMVLKFLIGMIFFSAIISLVLYVINPDIATRVGDIVIWNMDIVSSVLIGGSTAFAGLFWGYLLFSNIVPGPDMTPVVQIKAYVMAIGGFFIGSGLAIFFIAQTQELYVIGISVALFGYTAKFLVFTIWKFFKLDEYSEFRDVA